MRIQHVDTEHVQQVWPMVESYLQEALLKGHDFPEWAASYNIDHVRMYLSSGQWLLVVAVDDEGKIHGAASLSFINYPLHRVAFITAIGGKLIFNQDTFEQFKMILKVRGATKLQGYGRDSIVRIAKRYNFEARNTLIEVLI